MLFLTILTQLSLILDATQLISKIDVFSLFSLSLLKNYLNLILNTLAPLFESIGYNTTSTR